MSVDKLFPKEKTKDIPKAKIISALGNNVYKVRDDLGRYTNVYGPKNQKVGDTVRVIKGQIAGPSTVVTKVKTIQV